MKYMFLSALLVCINLASVRATADEAAVRQVLNDQVDAWNRGDIPAFMEGYWRSDELRFASGSSVVRGWQATLDRYLRIYDTAQKRGTLSFSDMQVDMLGADAAQVFGRWHLARDGANADGLFTLTFRRLDDGWKIVADHTSS